MTWVVVMATLIPITCLVGLAGLFIVMAAWHGHTDASREYAQDIVAALADIGMSHKEASITMGLTDKQELSKQLAGVKPLNLYRLGFLPVRFRLAFLRRQADRLGAALLAPEELALIRGAAVLGRRRLDRIVPERRTQKMTLPLGREQVA